MICTVILAVVCFVKVARESLIADLLVLIFFCGQYFGFALVNAHIKRPIWALFRDSPPLLQAHGDPPALPLLPAATLLPRLLLLPHTQRGVPPLHSQQGGAVLQVEQVCSVQEHMIQVKICKSSHYTSGDCTSAHCTIENPKPCF